MVLLGPVRNISALAAHDGTTAHNAPLAIPDRIANVYEHPLSIVQDTIKFSLLTIVKILAGPNVSEHVFRFLDDFEALSKIREYVDEQD